MDRAAEEKALASIVEKLALSWREWWKTGWASRDARFVREPEQVGFGWVACVGKSAAYTLQMHNLENCGSPGGKGEKYSQSLGVLQSRQEIFLQDMLQLNQKIMAFQE